MDRTPEAEPARGTNRVETELARANAEAAELLAELQDRVAESFARRCRRACDDDLTPRVLAGLTLSVLAVTFRVWFEQEQQDIALTADQVFRTLGRLICDDRQPSRQKTRRTRRP